MSAEVSYEMVMNVTSSWESLKRIPNYQDVAGEHIFLRVFQLEPKALALYQFRENEDIRANPAFMSHARKIVDMIDCAVHFLGPDLDPLADDLILLGQRHNKYGVKPEYLPVMVKAVFSCLEEVLGSKFTVEDRQAWQKVFRFILSKMRQGMN